ncbi:hypothetical protein C1Y08_08430 [Pseudomonas sp. FW306-02-F02-AA]|uniref:DUF3077 domain-containing protein n=1 Tax=Pseudomonas fluorescens TaxID=294 RepID=A0A0N7GZJ4_PSEFL|nr:MULTISPECIES: DUF6124 family protein [Pseudomonas]ALI00508.1 hypothetical protein AO353_05350 [Pseudomonas fluorescens]ALI00511.1 hypothetical protein AO353_05365 [Pseudomonas fluorescens]PMZ03630.1 hypothetical protein C1Y07_13625 [Pseudomonas sp. FW306-02-F02-AB]PMZ03633.1 hypothetical protein C1Y07_13640 [Pseudomonas sp. FW306-02-F02-AB]PMZ09784.1 hypothetical protein C1Y06_12280 [Pseudomonas sp. FW306-02-H06C]
MDKLIPDPPAPDDVSPYESLDSKKLHDAAHRALDHYLKPTLAKLRFSDLRSDRLFSVAPDVGTESLLANASEDLASVKVMAADLAFEIEGSRRHVALAICRLVDGVQLLVDRALDDFDVPEPAEYQVK